MRNQRSLFFVNFINSLLLIQIIWYVNCLELRAKYRISICKLFCAEQKERGIVNKRNIFAKLFNDEFSTLRYRGLNNGDNNN